MYVYTQKSTSTPICIWVFDVCVGVRERTFDCLPAFVYIALIISYTNVGRSWVGRLPTTINKNKNKKYNNNKRKYSNDNNNSNNNNYYKNKQAKSVKLEQKHFKLKHTKKKKQNCKVAHIQNEKWKLNENKMENVAIET